jgi:hypothetical protein
MSTNISPVTVTVHSIGSIRVYEDILLAHLVYKCIIKMAVWLWGRIDKMSKEESERNQAWVGCVPHDKLQPLTRFAVARIIPKFSYSIQNPDSATQRPCHVPHP